MASKRKYNKKSEYWNKFDKKNEDKWYFVVPPNINIMKCELGDTAMEYLWGCIEKQKKIKFYL